MGVVAVGAGDYDLEVGAPLAGVVCVACCDGAGTGQLWLVCKW